MRNAFLLSIGAVLLLSSASLAAILENQGFTLFAPNYLFKAGPAGSAQGGNSATVGQDQRDSDSLGNIALQGETAVLNQGAVAVGQGGASEVMQTALAAGGQTQGTPPPFQSQWLDVMLDQVVDRIGGVGSVQGDQAFVGVQNQIEVGPWGVAGNSNIVGAAQFSALGGGPCSNLGVNTNANLGVSQTNGNGGCCP
jgi:hypothetical protein